MQVKKNAFTVQLAVIFFTLSVLSFDVFSEPNISGIWNRYPDPYPDLFSPDPPPPGGEPKLKEPYKSQYEAIKIRQKEAEEKNISLATPSSLCRAEGVPTIMEAHYALQILQNPGQVTVLAEFMDQTRRIYMNEALPSLDELTLTYNGYAVGHWKGDVLEVQTIGIREDVQFIDIPHSENMKVTERIYLTAPNLLQNEITIEDPGVLEEPYKFTIGYKKEDASYKINEYVCEDNRIILHDDGSFSFDVEAH